MPDETHVIQVTNVSPVIAKDQLKTFFSYIGKIEDIKLYPELEAIDVSTRVCYVKYRDSEDVSIALHLTNTVFIDKALIVVPVSDDKIPDELTALGMGGSEGVNPSNMYQGLAQYPVLPTNTDISKVEEIRRTVYASNINSSLSPDKLMQFFSQAGEIKYMRMAGEENVSIRNAFIEYTDQNSVIKALGLNGHVLEGNQMRITPSNSAIAKPSMMPGVSATTKDIEEAMKKVSEAESMISAVADTLTNGRRRSRSMHRSRSRRSRSKGSGSRRKSSSRSRRSRYRSRSRKRSRSHRRSRRSRSRKSRSHDKGGRDKKSSRSRRSSRDKKPDNIKSKKVIHSRSDSKEREGSENSENRSRTKKTSKKKSDSISRRSRSRSRSKKAIKSYDNDHDKKSSRDEKDMRKDRHERNSGTQSEKESSSKKRNKSEDDRIADNQSLFVDKINETLKMAKKSESIFSQLDMDVDTD